MRWTTAEIASAVGGRLVGGDVVVDRVTQDSREIDPSSGSWLFVPLVAERDGHDFVPTAIGAGAVATFAAQSVETADAVVIEVASTDDALTALGATARDRLGDAAVIGITGSVGKTTTKDLLAAVLRRDRTTHANLRSFNNEIGVPLTLLGAPDDSRAVVLEMGARGVGHIATLCRTARPTVGIVTTVGKAHTSEFGSVEAVALGKGELVESLPVEGVAVLNADNPYVASMADRTEASVVTFGAAGEVRAEAITIAEDLIPSFRLVSPWGDVNVRLGVQGDHLIPNALAAAAAALPLGVSLEHLAAGLEEPDRSPMRMAMKTAPSGARIIDDTYNANPLSVAGAIEALAAVTAGRKVAVLGVMAELGESSRTDHERMVALAAEHGISVVAVDAPEYGRSALHAADIEEAEAALGPLDTATAVLVKGSRVAALERLVARLLG